MRERSTFMRKSVNLRTPPRPGAGRADSSPSRCVRGRALEPSAAAAGGCVQARIALIQRRLQQWTTKTTCAPPCLFSTLLEIMIISKAQIKTISSYKIAKFRDKAGVFVVEGEKMVEQAIKSSFHVQTICATEQWLNQNHQCLKRQWNR